MFKIRIHVFNCILLGFFLTLIFYFFTVKVGNIDLSNKDKLAELERQYQIPGIIFSGAYETKSRIVYFSRGFKKLKNISIDIPRLEKNQNFLKDMERGCNEQIGYNNKFNINSEKSKCEIVNGNLTQTVYPKNKSWGYYFSKINSTEKLHQKENIVLTYDKTRKLWISNCDLMVMFNHTQKIRYVENDGSLYMENIKNPEICLATGWYPDFHQ